MESIYSLAITFENVPVIARISHDDTPKSLQWVDSSCFFEVKQQPFFTIFWCGLDNDDAICSNVVNESAQRGLSRRVFSIRTVWKTGWVENMGVTVPRLRWKLRHCDEVRAQVAWQRLELS